MSHCYEFIILTWFTFNEIHPSPGRLNPAVTLPISAVEISFAWLNAWLAAVRIMSSSNCASAGFIACGSILIEAMVPSHLAMTFTAPPPLVASTVRAAEFGLDLFHLLLHARSLLHQFSNAGHNVRINLNRSVRRVSLFRKGIFTDRLANRECDTRNRTISDRIPAPVCAPACSRQARIVSSDSNSTMETRSPSSAANVLMEMKPGICDRQLVHPRRPNVRILRGASGRRRDRKMVMII